MNNNKPASHFKTESIEQLKGTCHSVPGELNNGLLFRFWKYNNSNFKLIIISKCVPNSLNFQNFE